MCRYRSGVRQGGDSRCSRWDQEKRPKREEASNDSIRSTMFSLVVPVQDISVQCCTGCYRLTVLLHYKSYTTATAPCVKRPLCLARLGREGEGEGMVEGPKICHADAGRTDRE